MSCRNCNPAAIRIIRAAIIIVIAGVIALSVCSRSPRQYRIGILVGADTMDPIIDGFKSGMNNMGYAEGKNTVYNIQRSKNDPVLEKRISGKFVSDNVDLVFAFPGRSANTVKLAAKESGIPVVFANGIVEASDLIDSVRRPGGNITGVRNPGPEMILKCFDSLLELAPRPRRILFIYDKNYPTNPIILKQIHASAVNYGVIIQELPVTSVSDIKPALRGLEKKGNARMNAIHLLPDTIPRSSENSDIILKFADNHRVPIAGGPEEMVKRGVVLSAAPDNFEMGALAASLADKILKGSPAGTIPVLSPELHVFINYKKAQKLGLKVPDGLLRRASGIIR